MWLTLGSKQHYFDLSEVRYVKQSKTEPDDDTPYAHVQRGRKKSDYYVLYEIV